MKTLIAENEMGEFAFHRQHCEAETGKCWIQFEWFLWFKCFVAVGREI